MYEPILGLEVHVELKTKTKMFCDCLNDSDEKQPNKNICPICLGHPGTLPVINKKAVESVLKVGLALESDIPEFSKFDRKNYFYPDLPKGYQISQYDEPLCRGGEMPLYFGDEPEFFENKIEITRIHLEEDTGKLLHPTDKKATQIDFNRAGVPLMELVTEPIIHSAKEARLFSQGLQLLLRVLGVSEADMEKGQMRCEVNISLRRQKSKVKTQKHAPYRPALLEKGGAGAGLGTKVEIKNLNSFRAVEKAIEFEIKRQAEALTKGEKIIQETRGWDPEKEITYSQRWKEEAQDYRYFPEPDLPPLHLYSGAKPGGLFDLKEMKENLPELPWETKKRLMRNYGISLEEANIYLESEKGAVLNFFEKAVGEIKEKRSDFSESELKRVISLISNYLLTDILGIIMKEGINFENLKISPFSFAELIINLADDKISSRVAKDALLEAVKIGKDPMAIIKEKGLEKISDEEKLLQFVEEVIDQNKKAVEDFYKGKETAIQFLVGQAMAKTQGAADPKILESLIRAKLGST